MKVDGVFSGGGIKAFAFLGALAECDRLGIKFERVAGASAGALIAALIAAGYRHQEIKKIIDTVNTEKFLDPHPVAKKVPIIKWLWLYFSLGLYQGKYIEKWIDDLLRAKGIRTFSDVDQSLYIIGADITNGRIAVFPDDLEPVYGIKPETFPVSKAVRISISIPYFFRPIKIIGPGSKQNMFIDGGTLSNFPYWIFKQKKLAQPRPTLGIKLSAEESPVPDQPINNAFDMLPAIVSTMIQAHDSRHISNSEAKNIMFIPIDEDIKATDFDLKQKDKDYLYHLGEESANTFFQTWSPKINFS
ncbi:patatin-like phospholipase family protein [Piscibacillus halophilus]|uniref:NTE family protein n=1 Tax=Piscibacillus halophilus TaxID=571933 RepID=A0A1H9ACQ3_9BACI|nr:patatin-like phospholipase family protein [Piscibacillus halophilus]SEP73758.1 NTE family protein [Piscibacillus halophilus]